MKIEAIKAYAYNRKIWLGCIWQLTPQSAKHYVFSPRYAAWRLLRTKRAAEWRR
jgi:hypothetical protein